MGRLAAGVVAGVVFSGAWLPGHQAAAAGRAAGESTGANLSVRLTTYPRPAQPGRPLAYRVEVANAGPGHAVRPELRLRLPEGIEVMHVGVPACRTESGNEVVCPADAEVLRGSRGEVTVTGMVRPLTRGPLHAVAAVAARSADADPADNTAEVDSEVGEGADLSMRLAQVRRPGRHLHVRVVVANHGPHAVTDGRLFLRARGARLTGSAGARCGGHRGFVGCRLREVRPGGGTSVRLAFEPAGGPGRPMTAGGLVYSAALGDRRPANDRAKVRLAPR